MEKDVIFFILDMGYRLKKLDVLHNAHDIQSVRYDDYDAIMLRRNAENVCGSDIRAFFDKIYPDDLHVIYIRKSASAE